MDNQNLELDAVQKIKDRYEIDFKWRAAWLDFYGKPEKGRLIVRQERIERKVRLANRRIDALFKLHDLIQKGISSKSQSQRDDGWYWIKKPVRGGEGLSEWTPALWQNEHKSWSSVGFSGYPDEGVLCGEKITHTEPGNEKPE